MFASNSELRSQWDKNVTEQHVVEQLGPGQDICYVAFRRIATVYPRDVVTLRVKCRLTVQPRVAEPADGLLDRQNLDTSCANSRDGAESGEDVTAYSSMSCSIDHPAVPESWAKAR